MGFDSQPLGEPQPPKLPIVITPKSSNETLATINLTSLEGMKQIGGEITQNAKELNPNIPWGKILDAISWRRPGGLRKAYTGKAAIDFAFATSIAGTAKAMGWDMHSPETVYMSGAAIRSLVRIRLENIAKALSDIENGSHQFPSEERRQQVATQYNSESGMLGMSVKKINESLEQYSKEHMPQAQNPIYLKVLEAFPFMGHESKRTFRDKAYKSFKEGDYATAASLLQEAKGVHANSPDKLIWNN